MQTFIKLSAEAAMRIAASQGCTVCFSPEIHTVLVYPVGDVDEGVLGVPCGFCRVCWNKIPGDDLARHAKSRAVNAKVGDVLIFPQAVTDESECVTLH